MASEDRFRSLTNTSLEDDFLKEILKQIKNMRPGSLLRVEWFDASTAKTAMGGPIDVPVKSWGIFLGIFGEKNKHVILAQNNFRMTEEGLYDIDYTAIPATWAVSVYVISPNEISDEETQTLIQSFIAGTRSGNTRRKGRVQRRTHNFA